MTEAVSLVVDGQSYLGWERLEITRSLENMAAGFALEVSERWTGQALPWQIKPGQACRLEINGSPLITGYIDKYEPSISATSHTVRVSGRSKTADLIDCSAVVPGGQFAQTSLAQLARALAAPFGVAVDIQTKADEPFPDIQIEPGETVFECLDKLARQRGVLLTDGPDGSLVITRPGSARASGALVEAENILTASATLDMSKRFSIYIGKAQMPGADDVSGEAASQVAAEAKDAAVPRYRPLIITGDASADGGMLASRVRWQALRHAGEGTQATVTVYGWRQPDGRLWTSGEMVRIKAPSLAIEADLVIVDVALRLDNQSGTTCQMSLRPIEALNPEPPKPTKQASGAPASSSQWTDIKA